MVKEAYCTAEMRYDVIVILKASSMQIKRHVCLNISRLSIVTRIETPTGFSCLSGVTFQSLQRVDELKFTYLLVFLASMVSVRCNIRSVVCH